MKRGYWTNGKVLTKWFFEYIGGMLNTLIIIVSFIVLVYLFKLLIIWCYKPKKCPKCKDGNTEKVLDMNNQFVRKCNMCDYIYESGWYGGHQE